MSKQEEASLIVKLYELRRDPVMRDARNWFFSFNPTSVQDFTEVMVSDKSAYYRMVVSYWDMAAALVNNGAIDPQMFHDANGEHVFVFAKIKPFLSEIRTTAKMPEYLAPFEKLVMSIPNIEERIAVMKERMTAIMALIEERSKAQAAAATQ